MPGVDRHALHLALDRSGLNAAQLAERSHTSRGYVSMLLSGQRRAKRNPALRARLAAALGVPVHWIEVHDTRPP